MVYTREPVILGNLPPEFAALFLLPSSPELLCTCTCTCTCTLPFVSHYLLSTDRSQLSISNMRSHVHVCLAFTLRSTWRRALSLAHSPCAWYTHVLALSYYLTFSIDLSTVYISLSSKSHQHGHLASRRSSLRCLVYFPKSPHISTENMHPLRNPQRPLLHPKWRRSLRTWPSLEWLQDIRLPSPLLTEREVSIPPLTSTMVG